MICPLSGKNTNGIFSDEEPLTNGEREHSAKEEAEEEEDEGEGEKNKKKCIKTLPSMRKYRIRLVNTTQKEREPMLYLDSHCYTLLYSVYDSIETPLAQ